jgi:uncharacterized protein
VTSVASRLVDVVDVERSSRTVAGLEQHLRTCTVEPWGLHTVRVDPDDPFVVLEQTWLLPDAGLRLRRCWAPGEDRCTSTTVGAVRVEVEDHCWFTTDLVLGLEVRHGRAARVAHAAEFAAALQGALLSPTDADDAMATVHRVLGEVVAERHDLRRWAASLGLSLA